VALLKRGQKEEGRKELLEALWLDPQLPKAYYYLGMMARADGGFEEAEELFKQAISLDPTHQAS